MSAALIVTFAVVAANVVAGTCFVGRAVRVRDWTGATLWVVTFTAAAAIPLAPGAWYLAAIALAMGGTLVRMAILDWQERRINRESQELNEQMRAWLEQQRRAWLERQRQRFDETIELEQQASGGGDGETQGGQG